MTAWPKTKPTCGMSWICPSPPDRCRRETWGVNINGQPSCRGHGGSVAWRIWPGLRKRKGELLRAWQDSKVRGRCPNIDPIRWDNIFWFWPILAAFAVYAGLVWLLALLGPA